MDSIVLELQRKALDKDSHVGELVRMAFVVAQKLGLKDFQQWARRELSGYRNTDDLPPYRMVQADVKVHNPYRGWEPVIFESPKTAEAAQSARCTNPIGELQHLIENEKPGGLLIQKFTPEEEHRLIRGLGVPLVPVRVISTSQVAGVLDAVRNVVLEWSLRLEQEGLLGEGITFSNDEKKKAATVSSIHINNFHGVLGDVQAEQVQIGDYNSIRKTLKQLGVPQDARDELGNILDEFKGARGKKKQSLAKQGLDWVAKHADTIGTLAGVIRAWFTSV